VGSENWQTGSKCLWTFYWRGRNSQLWNGLADCKLEAKRPVAAMGKQKMRAELNFRLGWNKGWQRSLLFICVPIQQKEPRYDNCRRKQL